MPYKQREKCYEEASLCLGDGTLLVEHHEAGVGVQGLGALGFVKKSVFKAGQKWAAMVTVWDRSKNGNEKGLNKKFCN